MDKWIGEADHQLARYHKYGEPLEESLYKEAASYNTPERQQYEAAKAERDVAAKMAAARATAQDRLESYGVDPSQTRSAALDLGSRVAEGAATAAAGNAARDQAAAVGRQLRSEAIQTAASGFNKGLQSTQAGTQSGVQALNPQLAVTASGAQTLGTGPQWTQIGSGAAGSWGDTQTAAYNAQMEKYKADQESGGGWGKLLGAGLSFASHFLPGMQEGGAIPEGPGVIPAEASPSGGAIPDDVAAQTDQGQPLQVNAGEFVVPKDVVGWLGEKGLQQIILKSRKEMQGGNGERPAQPSTGPAQIPAQSVGAIPAPAGG
jgi:hypothetical protein